MRNKINNLFLIVGEGLCLFWLFTMVFDLGDQKQVAVATSIFGIFYCLMFITDILVQKKLNKHEQ